MRKILMIILLMMVNYTFAQTSLDKNPVARKGFVMGVGLGAGALTLNTNDTTAVTVSATLPNIKVGYMLSEKFALLALLPGATYQYKGRGRGFEGLIIAGQYWVKEHWWVLGGAGLTFDAPAFYTVKDPETASFYTGVPAFAWATGYEVWHKGRFTVDVQYRIFLRQSELPNNGQREGISNMFLVGFNWY